MVPAAFSAILVGTLTVSCLAAGMNHPVFPVTGGSAEGYKSALQPLLAMGEGQMLELIPSKSGIYFCDCPNCTAGRQEGQFGSRAEYTPWSIEEPDILRCAHCGHVYPSEQYPMDSVVEVRNPRGETVQYPYYRVPDGIGLHFAARIDYHKIRYMETAALNFARVYALTGDGQFARRSALILQRFAQVYPGYCYHYDFPFQEKVIYDGDVKPEDFRPGFRTARWTWWAYMDIPQQLIAAYDLIAPGTALQELSQELGVDVDAQIVDFFTTAIRQVLANDDRLSNMSPGMWADAIRAGRVLGEPGYVHEALHRLRRFVTGEFFYDGAWGEGAPSYHSQVMGALGGVFSAAAGHSDPEGYAHPATGERFDDLDIETAFPAVARAGRALAAMRLPNGRLVPVHDTWSTNSMGALDRSAPYLLPALGHGCLGRGEGAAQVQANLTWSPGWGHAHYDGLSLLLFANGKELVSDIGYTHTRDRAWTLSTAAHNAVVVDTANQVAGRQDKSTYGALRLFYPGDGGCQILSVDNPQVYPGLTSTYRRTLMLIAVEGTPGYLVDVFEVAGGQQHDYFLHGSADEPQTLAVQLAGVRSPLKPLDTLLPEGVAFSRPRNEMETSPIAEPGFAYGYLEGLGGLAVTADGVAQVTYADSAGTPQLSAHLAAQAGDTLVTGQNPAVRGAGEDDGKLDDRRRQFCMLRRQGSDSVFAAVLEPLSPAPGTAEVRVLSIPGTRMALEVRIGERRDLILLGAEGAAGTWLDRELRADAELAFISAGGAPAATVVAGGVQWGDLALAVAAEPQAHDLLAVDREAGTLLCSGALPAAAGDVVLLDHAGRRISPYTVVSSIAEGDNTRLTVAEDPGFSWDARTQTAAFETLPRMGFTGAHRVTLPPVAQIRGQ